MPVYTWEDKKTLTRIEVIRSFSEYQIPPDREECKEMNDDMFTAADWERIVYGKVTVVRAPGFGGKGNWILLFGVSACQEFLDFIL